MTEHHDVDDIEIDLGALDALTGGYGISTRPCDEHPDCRVYIFDAKAKKVKDAMKQRPKRKTDRRAVLAEKKTLTPEELQEAVQLLLKR